MDAMNEGHVNENPVGCFPPDENRCRSLKQCYQINKELDNEMHRIKKLKRQYNLKEFQGDVDMYMLDPGRDDHKSRFVRYDPLMYALDIDPQDRMGDCTGPELIHKARGVSQPIPGTHRINPNKYNNFNPDEEVWTLHPKTSTTAVHKSVLNDRKRFKIYPAMYRDFKSVDSTIALDNEALHNDPSTSLSGVQYPISMRTQLRFLQDRGNPKSPNIDYDMRIKSKSGLIPQSSAKWTQNTYLNLKSNVDYDLNRAPNQAIIEDNFKNMSGLNLTHNPRKLAPNKSPKNCLATPEPGKEWRIPPKNVTSTQRAHTCGPVCTTTNCCYKKGGVCGGGCCDRFGIGPRTVGAPRSDVKDQTCSQKVFALRQAKGVSNQPIDWYKLQATPKSRFETTCNGCPKEVVTQQRHDQSLSEMGKAEKRIFKCDVNRKRPKYATYPSKDAMKSSFFGLGPAIPPPSPFLLSNVPSELLLNKRHLLDPDRSSIQYPDPEGDPKSGLRVDLQDPRPFDSLPDPRETVIRNRTRAHSEKDDKPQKNGDGEVCETFIGEPPESQRKPTLRYNLDGYRAGAGTAHATPASQLERVRPNPSLNPSKSGRFNPEFSVRNKSLETELKDTMRFVEQQSIATLRQIADIRSHVSMLKQRELDAKAVSNLQDAIAAIGQFEKSIEVLNQLRRLKSRLDKKHKHLVSRLKAVMPPLEFRKFESKLKNRIHHEEQSIKRYYSDAADDEIVGYQQRDFQGDGFQFKPGFYDYPHTGGLGNNKLQSLKVGKNVTVILYERAKRKGQVLVYHGPRRIPRMPVLWENRVSGIEILPKVRVGVVLYDAPFFQGGRVRAKPGFHDGPDVGGIGMNKLQSMVIPSGLKVTLYSQQSKKGESVTYLGPQRLSFLPGDWSRKVAGISVNYR